MFKFFLLLILFLVMACQEKTKLVPVNTSLPGEVPPSVAQIIGIKPSVKQRPTLTTEWNQAYEKLKLQNKDEIKTGEGAWALIEFSSGKSSLNVEENSFVVIWDRDEEKYRIHVVALPEGELKGVISPQDGTDMEIRTPSGWIKTNYRVEHKDGVEIKVSSRGMKNAFKVSVSKGEATVVTANETAHLKAGKSLKILHQGLPLMDYMEEIPAKTNIIKEKKFQVEFPSRKNLKVKSDTIQFSGIWEGEFSVWANGILLKGDDTGRFKHTFKLTPGLNVFTFQVSDPEKNNVEYYIYKITRDIGP